MFSTVFWCLLVVFLFFFFWLYCITTATPFIPGVTPSNDEVKAGHFYLAAESWTSRNKNAAFFAAIQIRCKFFQLQSKRETSFSSLGDNAAFCAKRETRGGENSTPNIVGLTMFGIECSHLRPCW